MDRVKNIIKETGVGFYLSIVAMIIALVTIFLYKSIGITAFSPSLNQQTILFLILGIVVTAISLVLNFIPVRYVKMCAKPARFVAYLLFLYAFLMFVYSQINFIANVFVGIDGNHFSAAFIITMIFYILACVITCVSAGLNDWTPWNKKAVKEGKANE